MSPKDQETVVTVMKAAESLFVNANAELSYWWSGLRDENDDGVWEWVESEKNI